MSLFITSLDKGIATLTFNHPETCNSLSNALLNELIETLQLFEKHKARAVIIRAEKGVKVWSSGTDSGTAPQGIRQCRLS